MSRDNIGDAADGEARWRAAGDRIETLLEASSAGGAAARQRAEDLVGEVVGLYGAGLGRIMALLDDAGRDRVARDDLVGSLLIVHGLHPHDVHTRVETALESVRPYLGSHGGDVRLIDVVGPVVHLELAGNCRSCPSSAVTLELAVEDAVRAAAPEIESIEVVAAASEPVTGTFSADSLFAHVRTGGAEPVWSRVPEVEGLSPGEVAGFVVGDASIMVCRVDDTVFAYRDRCPVCEHSLSGAVLQRRIGYARGDAVMGCRSCGAHFDVVHAGARVDNTETGEHLDPLPLLPRDGVLSVALPAVVAP